jgi:hypothetical protein
MSYNEFKLCKGCPVKGARYFDPDGYWCCKHPDAAKHEYPNEDGTQKERPLYEPGDSIPFVCMKTCPANHWKRTIEGGQIPKGQLELVTDAERIA